MKIFIATDFYAKKYQGRLYYGSAFYTILERYAKAFGEVVVCSRIQHVQEPPTGYDVTELIKKHISTNGLLEAFTGKVKSKIKKEILHCDLVVARVPGIVAFRASECAQELNKPYFAEIMGCAWDAYWNHGIVGKIIAPYMFYKMKKCVYNADYALYVTEKFLQEKYPSKCEYINASNVDISVDCNEVIENRINKNRAMNQKKVTLMTAAAIDVRYKGQEYVIKALHILIKNGIDAEYRLIGGGDKKHLESVAKKYGVLDKVVFVGEVTHEDVIKELDSVDIYIQPSLQEGLPRSVIEAMSRGCICLGARTAGIPELIDEKFVFKRKSAADVANTVRKVFDIQDLSAEANRNYEKAKLYDSRILDRRRKEYYRKIIENLTH